MIGPQEFFQALRDRGIGFFAGVPDSLLKDFCAYVTDHTSASDHIIAANEGGAVALAAGHFLATGRPGLVYMQNSGQGNAVNPLTSLADPAVFGIPMLLLIGWRAEPGVPDEPQHAKQGAITLTLLETLGIEYEVLPESIEAAERMIDRAVATMTTSKAPFAIVVRKGAFAPYTLQKSDASRYSLRREAALGTVVDAIDAIDDAVVVATTGMTSRELYEYREQTTRSHRADFRTVGSMGHASQIALGIALARPDRQVFCLDGDGATIMQMGGLAIIGTCRPDNFKHVIFNNAAHDSVGGQPTAGFEIDIPAIARACGYRRTLCAETIDQTTQAMAALTSAEGPALVEIRVAKGARADLGRPRSKPRENKQELMEFLAR